MSLDYQDKIDEINIEDLNQINYLLKIACTKIQQRINNLCDKYSLDFSPETENIAWDFYPTFHKPNQTHNFYYSHNRESGIEILSIKDVTNFREIRDLLQALIDISFFHPNLENYSPILR